MNVRFHTTQALAAYNGAFGRLRALPGYDQQRILTAEGGTLLKAWAGKTKEATREKVDARARGKAAKIVFGESGTGDNPYNLSISGSTVFYHHPSTGRKQFAGMVGSTGQFAPANVHFTAEAWDRIKSGLELYSMEVEKQIELGRDSIGLARQSVVQIADELGIDLGAVPGAGISSTSLTRARAAIASNGRNYRNGNGTRGGNSVRSYVQFLCRLPFNEKIGMRRALAGVVAGRAKFIETAFRKGAMDSIRTAQRAFPNVFRVTE